MNHPLPKYKLSWSEDRGQVSRIIIDLEKPIWAGKFKDVTIELYEEPKQWSDAERFGALAKVMSIAYFDIQHGGFHFPYAFKPVNGEPCLCLRPMHILEYIRTAPHLTSEWKSLRIRSPRALTKAMRDAGVVVKQTENITFNGQRYTNCYALNITALKTIGVII